jgi:hypothetical protein
MDTKNKPEKMTSMKCYVVRRTGAGNPHSTLTRSLAVLGILVAGLQYSQAHPLYSPHGAEVFDGSQMSAAVAIPPLKRVRISWGFPSEYESPDLVFKLYHSTKLTTPLPQWEVLTNVPGNLRSTVVFADKACEFFALSASNYLGESGFAPR